ncbi:MAG: hypothetical protein AN484_25925, partial [Aphanizomenon flos-aquae WA102]
MDNTRGPGTSAESNEDMLKRIETAVTNGSDVLSPEQLEAVTALCKKVTIDPEPYLDTLRTRMLEDVTNPQLVADVYRRELLALQERAGSLPGSTETAMATRASGTVMGELGEGIEALRKAIDEAQSAMGLRGHTVENEAKVRWACETTDRRWKRLTETIARLKEAAGLDVRGQDDLDKRVEVMSGEVALTFEAKSKWMARFTAGERTRRLASHLARLERVNRLAKMHLDEAENVGRALPEDMIREGSDFADELSAQRSSCREEGTRLIAAYPEDASRIDEITNRVADACSVAIMSTLKINADLRRRQKATARSDGGGSVTDLLRRDVYETAAETPLPRTRPGTSPPSADQAVTYPMPDLTGMNLGAREKMQNPAQ